MALSTRHPAVVMWGPELICLYNDAFKASLGPEKHPFILGRSGRDAWVETWPLIGAELESVLAGGPPTWHENQLVPIERNGRLEDVYWTYSSAGIEDETASNGTGGVLVLCAETTAHVQAAERSRSERQRLGRLFEDAPVFIAVVSGSDYRFELANPAYRRLVGRDVIGRTVAEAFPEVIGQGYLDILDGVYQTGDPYVAQGAKIEFQQPDGRPDERRIDFAYQPTRDAAGAVDGIFVVGVDVTERAGAERALAVSEEQLRLAIELGGVGLWDVDPVADDLFWPPRVREMFGIFSDRPVTMADDFVMGMHPDDRAMVMSAYSQAVDPAKRATYDVEYRTVGREDGVIRWVAAKGRGIFDEAGVCVRVIGTAVDITARKRSEARLHELNENLERRLSEHLAERKLLSDIVEEADTLIQVADMNFRLLAINRACADAFESVYRVRPRVGDSLLDLLQDVPEQRELVRSYWQRAFESDAFVAVEKFGDPALQVRAFELHFRALRDESGRRIGAYQFVYDVTERTQAEERLAQAEEALLQARKMEAVGLLTGGIAHDFNNLLQALGTKFELLQRRPSDPDYIKEWARSGAEVVRRGAKLTAQLLTFSRQQAPDIRAVEVGGLLRAMRDLLRTTVGPTIAVTVDCAEVWARADVTQLEMALLNLAVNARDAMPGGGLLNIRVRKAAQRPGTIADGEYVEFRVTDSGTGMQPDVLAKAFEPFFTTKALGRGSGLGLSQVYGMAQRAGGTVQIESDGTHGTCVVFFLPVADAELEAEANSPALPAMGERARALKVLVVDDDEAVRRTVSETLSAHGHTVLEAESGDAALSTLQEHDPDLALVDFAMPGVDGATFAKLARTTRVDLPVVFMSGYADANAILEAVGHGATLLRKPFEASALFSAISRATAN